MNISRLCKTVSLRQSALAVLVLLLFMVTTACGKKGPVRPKLATLPQPPAEITLQQQGNIFLLGWTIPAKNQGGEDAEDLVGFRIKRLSYDAAEGCPTCREPQTEVAELDLKSSPAFGQRIGNRLYWRDLEIRTGIGYRYAIVPLTLGGQEGSSGTIHLVAQQPPPAPSALKVNAGNAQVTVQWAAPILDAEMELIGYNLYRRESNRPFPIIPLNPEPLQETRLLDRSLENGRTYEYRVSALVQSGDQQLESMASQGALSTPQKGL
jgi:predicted small lipoprotein YifL